jgi:uncharacterized repeat protein (TIGR01451 family)
VTARQQLARLAGVVVASGVALGVLVPAVASAEPTTPQLSISVDNGHTAARAGDTLTYTVVVDNVGADAVTGLRVTQTVPTGLTLGSADAGGARVGGEVVWSVDVPAADHVTVHTTMELGSTPGRLRRLAVVACAAAEDATTPTVCASHSDLLPAGAAVLARRAAAASSGAARGNREWDAVLALVAVVAAAAATLTVARRRLLTRRERATSRP